MENADQHLIHYLWDGALTAGATIMGFFGKRVVEKIDENSKSISDHELYDAQHYATKDDLKVAIANVTASVDKIEQKLDDMPEKLALIFRRRP